VSIFKITTTDGVRMSLRTEQIDRLWLEDDTLQIHIGAEVIKCQHVGSLFDDLALSMAGGGNMSYPA